MLGIARADLTNFDVLRRLGGINVPAAVVARGNEVKLLGQIVHRHGLHIAGVVDDDLCQAAAVGGLVTQPGASLGIITFLFSFPSGWMALYCKKFT